METKRLGRGLGALLNADLDTPQEEVAIDRIGHNPFQPRKKFDDEEIASLSASVKTLGILQPLIVRQSEAGYQIIAGERRFRAAQDAGLKTVPVRVVDFNDQQAFEAALVENIQRTDLNPIEKALGFKDYMERFNLNQEQLAKRLGLPRSSVANLVHLLDLAPELQDGIRLNQITEAHAKLLKGIKDKERQVALFKQIVAMGLSVKATEALVRDQKVYDEEREAAQSNGESGVSAVPKSAHVKGIEEELRSKLAMRVEIRLRDKDKGQIVLRFDSNDDFERLLEVLRR
jgi:ParB family transcriptional regulator, chromosome partitioning protein